MTNILILAVVGFLVGLAASYVYKAKKSGRHCIGCPDSGSCNGHCSGCSCSCTKEHQL